MTESATASSPDDPAPADAPDASDAPTARTPSRLITATLARPFAAGFAVTLGGILAVVLALAFNNLSSILISITLALFIALALDPIVRALERRGASPPIALAIVVVGSLAVFLGVMGLLVPVLARQVVALISDLPTYFDEFRSSEAYSWLVNNVGDGLPSLIQQVETLVLSPSTLSAIGGGVLQVGLSLVSGLVSGLIVFVLTLYFTASLGTMKQALYRLAPAWSRPRVEDLTERITVSVGAYLKGMVTLAFFNAVFAMILHAILGLPFAVLMGVAAFFITVIPLIGTATFWVLGTLFALFTSPEAALAFAVVYGAYMEFEAYFLTPRVMSRAIAVPGALVVIGAMIGGTLLGFLGALVAIPVTASILLIIREIVIPRQDAKLLPGPG